jgi:hypothetical protein
VRVIAVRGAFIDGDAIPKMAVNEPGRSERLRDGLGHEIPHEL